MQSGNANCARALIKLAEFIQILVWFWNRWGACDNRCIFPNSTTHVMGLLQLHTIKDVLRRASCIATSRLLRQYVESIFAVDIRDVLHLIPSILPILDMHYECIVHWVHTINLERSNRIFFLLLQTEIYTFFPSNSISPNGPYVNNKNKAILQSAGSDRRKALTLISTLFESQPTTISHSQLKYSHWLECILFRWRNPQGAQASRHRNLLNVILLVFQLHLERNHTHWPMIAMAFEISTPHFARSMLRF